MKYPDSDIIIVGPSPEKKVAGIVTHVRNLLTYKPLVNARVFDVGSLNSPFREDRSSLPRFFRQLFRLRRETAQGNSVFLVNSSIYKSSVYKLILILVAIKGNFHNRIFVFFHGGRADNKTAFPIKLLGWLNNLLFKVDCYYFLSSDQKSDFDNLTQNMTTSIYNNYSSYNSIIKRNPQTADDIIRFLFVGRLNREKGVVELLKATNYLVKNGVRNFRLTIAGDGNILQELKDYIKNEGLDQFVEFTGFIEGDILEKVYSGSDCLVFPTYSEGFPYVYIEAMRAGLPVITTKAGALGRLIKEGVNGFFVESRNVSDLAGKMRFFIETRPSMTENCYNEFTGELSRKHAESFYAALVG